VGDGGLSAEHIFSEGVMGQQEIYATGSYQQGMTELTSTQQHGYSTGGFDSHENTARLLSESVTSGSIQPLCIFSAFPAILPPSAAIPPPSPAMAPPSAAGAPSSAAGAPRSGSGGSKSRVGGRSISR